MAKIEDYISPERIEFRSGTTKIHFREYLNVVSLTSVVFPNTLIEIENSAFRGCSKLTEIDFPNSLEIIGGGAFAKCISLKSIDIPGSVKKIDELAFAGCNNLRSIDFAYGLEYIGERAFEGCNSLKRIVIPGSVQYIGMMAFEANSLKEMIITNGVRAIHCGAFCNTIIEELFIPESTQIVTSWGTSTDAGVFSQIPLKTILVDKNNLYHTSKDGVLYDKYLKRILRMPEKCVIERLELPESIETIGRNAFTNCNNLRRLWLPKSLSRIDEGAFWNCESLEEIHISVENVNSISFIDKDCWSIDYYSDVFSDSIKNVCTLFVPPGTRWEYRHHPIFGEFKNIEVEY